MNISKIEYSVATKSLDIFISGCLPPYCSQCCNPELISFDSGEIWDNNVEHIGLYIERYSILIENIFLVGGSPNHQDSGEIEPFLSYLKIFNKPIWLFAREELEDIQEIFKEYCDYIKCGAYVPELICNNNTQHGIKLATSNQKIYSKGISY